VATYSDLHGPPLSNAVAGALRRCGLNFGLAVAVQIGSIRGPWLGARQPLAGAIAEWINRTAWRMQMRT